jgi:sugar/nucleoside kinase (ribokinase family)
VSTLVVGSIALDTVETPFGTVENVLGGTAVYFSLAASFLTDVRLVGVAGRDFPDDGIRLLRERGVDLSGLQLHAGDTFRWAGKYGDDMDVAITLDTQLNVFESFQPALPAHYRDAEFVFLGNIDPELQLDVLRQVRRPVLTALDTMNFWIDLKRDTLTKVLRQVNVVLINEGEIRQYTGSHNVFEAAEKVMQLGPQCVVVKRGEHGAVLVTKDDLFFTPAFPTREVKDTTGAGDSFAGGFLGYLDFCRGRTRDDFRAAMAYGTAMASHAVEGFSVEGLLRGGPDSVHRRCDLLAQWTRVVLPNSNRNDYRSGRVPDRPARIA